MKLNFRWMFRRKQSEHKLPLCITKTVKLVRTESSREIFWTTYTNHLFCPLGSTLQDHVQIGQIQVPNINLKNI